jgi:AAA domain
MSSPHQSPPSHPASSVTGTNSPSIIVDTLEHRRFAEFCEASRRYGYIGLCYGASGVGKTVSARSYSRWAQGQDVGGGPSGATDGGDPTLDTILYTPSVVNAPGGIEADIRRSREALTDRARRPVRREQDDALAAIRRRDDADHATFLSHQDWLADPRPARHPTYAEVAREYFVKAAEIRDPTTLIVIDEADRLRMASLEQVRAIFDASAIGVILIGMPGLEKRLARYPQFYSRIGFVHEFRPLSAGEMRHLLEQAWTPPGVHLPPPPWDPDTVAAIIRSTGGNFRLLHRLLTQIARLLDINALREMSHAVVEAARESLVIGQA